MVSLLRCSLSKAAHVALISWSALAIGAGGVAVVPSAAVAQTETFRAAVAEASADDPAISGFYQAHDYASLWTGTADAARRAALIRVLQTAGDQGLPEARYDVAGLKQKFMAVQSEAQRARLEVLTTRAYLRYARDVSSGLVVPADVDPGIVRTVHHIDARVLLEGLLTARPLAWLESLPPQRPEYAELQRAAYDLAGQMQKGWGPHVQAEKLEPGAQGPAVIALRDRLIALGYLAPTAGATFDDRLKRAVQAFQVDNGMSPDGVAGKGTIAEINRDPEDRLKSVLVAMERMRWMNGVDLSGRYIWVNLPDFTAKVIDDGKVTFQSVTVVGQNTRDTRSPEFSDQMEFLVVNPTWNVPRSITVKEYLPKLQADPTSVSQLRITDRQGKLVDPTQVDFTQFDEHNFPFHMSQAPSDGNALGKVKFMFPNPWNIYLHDTPQKALFGREVRAFSHGCIRLGDPFNMAYTLLARQSDDPKGLFKSYLGKRAEATLRLAKPVPVHLVYFTAWPDARGHVGFRRDIYGRDARIFEALQAAGVVLPSVQG